MVVMLRQTGNSQQVCVVFFPRSHTCRILEFDFHLYVSVLQRGAICPFAVLKWWKGEWPLYPASTLWNATVWVECAGAEAAGPSGATTSWYRRTSMASSLRSADGLCVMLLRRASARKQEVVPRELQLVCRPWPDPRIWLVVQVSDRYRLTGDILDGEMDLDILSLRRTDSGPYCCRVDIDGVFNDKKVIMNLRVVKGEQLQWPVGKQHHHDRGVGGFRRLGFCSEFSVLLLTWKTLTNAMLI